VSKLDAAARKALPASAFAGPDRSYPIPDKAHAVAAKSRAAQFASPALKAKVDAAADRKLAHPVGKCAHGDCDSAAAFGG
jgi:hypothetical protein